MCFAPQQGALFRHVNFQKWSDTAVFCTSWLRNVLRATTACTFSTSQLRKKCSENGVLCTFWLRNVLRTKTACNFLFLSWPDGSAPALASLLFDPPEPHIIGKTPWIATFLPFRAPASSFFWLFLFSSLLFSDSSHLCFSICKLPSMTIPTNPASWTNGPEKKKMGAKSTFSILFPDQFHGLHPFSLSSP